MDIREFLMRLTPDQKQSMMSISNQIIDTLECYLMDVKMTALNSQNICLFAFESMPETYGVVENPSLILAASKSSIKKITSSIYLDTLKSFSVAKADPQKRQSLIALASECALLLLTGRNDIVEQPRDLS